MMRIPPVTLVVLWLLAAAAQAQAPDLPQLTADQQKDLRIVEQEAEKALLAYQLAEARFLLAREALAKQLTTLQPPGYRLEKGETGWRFVRVEAP